jgi:hypothetical protein
LAYPFGFSAELRTRRTSDWDIREVRAIAAGLRPALNEAWMRFTFPAGTSSRPLILLLRRGRPGGDAPISAAEAGSFLVAA